MSDGALGRRKLAQFLGDATPQELNVRCGDNLTDLPRELFCFELFRRAIEDGCMLCWSYIHNRYFKLVYHWVSRSSPPDYETIEDLTQDAFTAFWRFFTRDKLARAKHLGAVLAYLKDCATSSVQRAKRRAKSRFLETELDASWVIDTNAADRSVEETSFQRAKVHELWQAVVACCNDERDLVIVEATFLSDLKPSEIAHEFPGIFDDVFEVYRIKRNLLNRLKRNPDLKSMCENASNRHLVSSAERESI